MGRVRRTVRVIRSRARKGRAPVRAGTVGILVALVLSGCFLLPKEEAQLKPPLMKVPDISYDTVTAERRTIVDQITGVASFRYVTVRPAVFTAHGGTLASVNVNYGDKVQKGQVLATLSSGTLDLDVQLQAIDVQKAQLALDRLKAMSADKFQLQESELDLKAAQVHYDYLKRELSDVQVLSPISGIITYVTNAAIGDSVQAYQPILQVADPSRVGLVYDGPRYQDFNLGDDVQVTYKKQEYDAKVSRGPADVPYDAPDSERQRVLIDFTGKAPSAPVGDIADINMVVKKKDNVIVIPRNLVQTFLGSRIVYVLKNGLKEERLVEVGIETATEAEIVKGLEAGDKVITR